MPRLSVGSSRYTAERLDWDLRLLVLALQISYFLLSPLGFPIYETDIATPLENCFEIHGENCDRISSVLITAVDIAIIIGRMKTLLCRSDSRIRFFHNFAWSTQPHKQYFLLRSDCQTNDGATPVFIFLFVQNSFISRKRFCSAHVTSAFRMCFCATQMNTSLSQLGEIKIISAHGRKMIQFLTIAQSAPFGLQAKSVSLTCTYPLAGLQAIRYQLLISRRYSLELQPPVKKGALRSGSRVAVPAWRPMQATSLFREEQASALFELHRWQHPRYLFTFPLHCSLELVWVSLHQWFSNRDLWIPMDNF